MPAAASLTCTFVVYVANIMETRWWHLVLHSSSSHESNQKHLQLEDLPLAKSGRDVRLPGASCEQCRVKLEIELVDDAVTPMYKTPNR
jgi:hypothetical protein